MLTIYMDKENIKNVDEIQKIYEQKFIEKSKSKMEVEILDIIKEIKEKIDADKSHKLFLEFKLNLLNNLIIKEEKDLSIFKDIISIDEKKRFNQNYLNKK